MINGKSHSKSHVSSEPIESNDTQQQDTDCLQTLQELCQVCHTRRQQTCDSTSVAACPTRKPHLHQLDSQPTSDKHIQLPTKLTELA